MVSEEKIQIAIKTFEKIKQKNLKALEEHPNFTELRLMQAGVLESLKVLSWVSSETDKNYFEWKHEEEEK